MMWAGIYNFCFVFYSMTRFIFYYTTEQSRRCPLCSQNIGDHAIHNLLISVRLSETFSSYFANVFSKTTATPDPGLHKRTRRIPREFHERNRIKREEQGE
ncbi:hypothetical protein BDP27DRAFT_1317293 [Rhodocollybia butyracea]|uniref:Uncharacterized protein n=1 Tax=Rhodocollybia butyracea TaxID=206335 RepID=A0A9P5Q3S7_9AGAR|nr:hypothetical protein BDP27DRAFT_1317293 [Rhodocollybia butyracea]